MSIFINNCFVINIKVQKIRQPLVEYKWLVTKSYTVSVTICFTNLANCCFRAITINNVITDSECGSILRFLEIRKSKTFQAPRHFARTVHRQPTSFPGFFPFHGAGGAPDESLLNGGYPTQCLVINYHMIPIPRVKI